MTIRHFGLAPRFLLLILGYAVLVIVAHAVVLPSSAYNARPGMLGAALLFDLTVWPLLAFYWLVARPQRWSTVRVGLVGLALLRLAMWWLPNPAMSGQAVPAADGALWPLLLGTLEGAVLLIAAFRIRTITQTYLSLRRTHDAETALQGAFAAVFGNKVAHLILSEGLIFYYALFGWRLRAHVPAGALTVTSHRESGQLALLWGLLGISLIELGAMHLLLLRWSPTVAFWVTLGSAYGCFMVVALIQAIQKRPSYLTHEALHLRLDLRWQAIIRREQIATITPTSEKPPKQPGLLNASLLATPNVLITLREPIRVIGLYGIERTISRLTLFVDDRERLLSLATDVSC